MKANVENKVLIELYLKGEEKPAQSISLNFFSVVDDFFHNFFGFEISLKLNFK